MSTSYSNNNMASDDTMTIHSSMHEDDQVDDIYDELDDHLHLQHQQHHTQSLSRLSICTTSSKYENDDDGGDGDDMMMFMSQLSIEGSDHGGDADEEFSEDDDSKGRNVKGVFDASSDSDKEIASCLSLPGTPHSHIKGKALLPMMGNTIVNKEYYSENEVGGKKGVSNKSKKKYSRRRVIRERWLDREWEKKKYKAKAMDEDMNMMMMMDEEQNNNNILSGESECLVITRPNGGRRSLCMDLEEVKACRDLGFELEHERMLEIPSRLSMSCSTIDTATTSSGGNSPIANWRISSPGDDPRDVKARLKVWAQAVALASASRLVG